MCDSSDNENLSVCKKTIGELSADAKSFFIPSYQRGYRWGEKEVEQLFVDLWEAKEANKEYCLQPLVVMKKGTQWRVIDGQQRLTTLYILLKVLGQEPGFSLEYETRPGSKGFLANIATVKEEKRELEARKNPDYWHMWKAKEKLEEKKTDKKLDAVKQKAFASWIKAKTFFLWYEPEGKEHEIFARLNSGKIPLSNAELIKAELLASIVGEGERQLRAATWDHMEQWLQDDRFWCFVNPDLESARFEASRMDFLLELWARQNEQGLVKKLGMEQYAIYDWLREKPEEHKQKALEVLWEEMTACFQRFEEWYDDVRIYHRIGFFARNNNAKGKKWETLKDVLDIANNKPKKTFLKELNEKCKEVLRQSLGMEKGEKVTQSNLFTQLGELSYEGNKSAIRDVLLLFNVALTEWAELLELANDKPNLLPLGEDGGRVCEETRFPFEAFCCKEWSLEHIHAQADNESQEEGGSDVFGNMALLPGDFNSEFNKRTFEEKQKCVCEWAKGDESKCRGFIPIGTRWVFQRKFGRTDVPHEEEWDAIGETEGKDGEAYRKKVAKVVVNYLSIK